MSDYLTLEAKADKDRIQSFPVPLLLITMLLADTGGWPLAPWIICEKTLELSERASCSPKTNRNTD